MKNITLDQFVKIMQKDIEGFKKQWQEQIDKGNVHYPKTLNEGDWFEQFLAYESMTNGKE